MTSPAENPKDPELDRIRKLIETQQYDEAWPAAVEALRNDPCSEITARLVANTYTYVGEIEAAAALFDELAPVVGKSPLFMALRGQAIGEAGRFTESLSLLERAHHLRPDDHEIAVGYSMALLRSGDLTRGWKLYQHRKFLEPPLLPKEARIPEYTGGNLKRRTLLVIAEQGLGDTIMLARYIPLLARRGGRIVVVAQPELVDLLRTLPGNPSVIPLGAPIPSFQVYARMMSLPAIFGTSLWDIPKDVPYLRAPAHAAERWQNRLAEAKKKRVGLVWAGNPNHPNDRQRSMHFDDLTPLLDLQGIQFFSLQIGERRNEAEKAIAASTLIDLGSQIQNMSHLAAVIGNLDLVISIDSAPAHLAAAMGKQVWAMIPFAPEWRWMLKRSDSPWYPTLRVTRQQQLRDWRSVVAATRDALLRS